MTESESRRRPPEILTDAEVRALLAQCSRRAPTGIRDRALIVLLYRTGLRISEALDLKLTDMDRQRGTVSVLDGKGHKPRTVGIDDEGIAEVQIWIAERARLGLSKRGVPLFCTLKGGRSPVIRFATC